MEIKDVLVTVSVVEILFVHQRTAISNSEIELLLTDASAHIGVCVCRPAMGLELTPTPHLVFALNTSRIFLCICLCRLSVPKYASVEGGALTFTGFPMHFRVFRVLYGMSR